MIFNPWKWFIWWSWWCYSERDFGRRISWCRMQWFDQCSQCKEANTVWQIQQPIRSWAIPSRQPIKYWVREHQPITYRVREHQPITYRVRERQPIRTRPSCQPISNGWWIRWWRSIITKTPAIEVGLNASKIIARSIALESLLVWMHSNHWKRSAHS